MSAALQLWTERGFAHGIESTTVEEITRAAGVSRNTFYFHFAHKHDVLLEMSLTTSDAMHDAAQRAAAEGDTIDDVMVKSFNELARRTERLPRAAASRMLREFHEFPTRAREPSVLHGMFRKLFAEAQSRGELPSGVDPDDLSDMFYAFMIAALSGWVEGAYDALGSELELRTRVMLAGVRAVHDT